MDTPAQIEFFEDDEDVKYVELEGKLEVRFSLSEMDEHAEKAKEGPREDILARLNGMAMEVTLAFLEEVYPIVHNAMIDHYNLDVTEEEKAEAQDQTLDLLPGFMAEIDGGEIEDP